MIISQNYLEKIISVDKAISLYTHIPIDIMHSEDRRSHVVYAKFISWYILHEKFAIPYKVIGYAYNNKDHGTIMNGVDRVNSNMEWKTKADKIYITEVNNRRQYH